MSRRTLTFHAGGLPHYAERLVPLYLGLPPEYRGTFYAKGRAKKRAMELGVSDIRDKAMYPEDRELVIVASHEDYRRVHPAKVIMVAHGVGQTYVGVDHPAYSGGRDRDRVVLNLVSGPYDAAQCQQPVVACGPWHIDRWLRPIPWDEPGADAVSSLRQHVRQITRAGGGKPTICFSTHADIHVTEETRWSFPHFEDEIVRIVRECSMSYNFIGHAHPRVASYMKDFWQKRRVEFVPLFSDVLDRADLYITDNSSTLYEFAATGRPVICLNGPHYRKDVHHGLRFWDAVPGMQVDRPDCLLGAINVSLVHENGGRVFRKKREEAVRVAYGDLADGHATERAIRALMEFLDAA